MQGILALLSVGHHAFLSVPGPPQAEGSSARERNKLVLRDLLIGPQGRAHRVPRSLGRCLCVQLSAVKERWLSDRPALSAQPGFVSSVSQRVGKKCDLKTSFVSCHMDEQLFFPAPRASCGTQKHL